MEQFILSRERPTPELGLLLTDEHWLLVFPGRRSPGQVTLCQQMNDWSQELGHQSTSTQYSHQHKL